MLCWMTGKGFGIHESYVGTLPFTYASQSHFLHAWPRIIQYASGDCVLARSCGHTRYVTQVCRSHSQRKL